MSVKYACDRCGRIITGKRGYISWCYHEEDGDLTENVLEGTVYCESCMEKAKAFLGSAPELKAPKQEERPKKQEEKPKGRVRWDDGKIRALLSAGWSQAKIADELGIPANTLSYHVKHMEEGKHEEIPV